MSRNKGSSLAMIGLFVLGAFLVVVAGVLYLGRDNLFSKKLNYVIYFNDSVKGLYEGSWVTLRGVRVGTVSNIQLYIDGTTQEVLIPVELEIDPDTLGATYVEGQELIRNLVSRGLRAQMSLESIVTGRNFINLTIDKSAEVIPINYKRVKKQMEVIPTIYSPLDGLSKKLQNLPIEEVITKTLNILDEVESTISSQEVDNIIENIDSVVAKLAKSKVITSYEDLAVDIHKILVNIEGITKDLNSEWKNIPVEIKQVIQQMNQSMGYLKKSLENAPDISNKISKVTNEMIKTARAIRFLAEQLEKDPNSVVFGK